MLLSILTPVYNAEKYLLRTADSVCTQGIDNWEWILVDDGSTDSSGKICDALAVKDSRIKVVHQLNSGPAEAKNEALRLASGEYVTFLDADDTLRSNTLRENLPFFERYPDLEIVRFPIWYLSKTGEMVSFHNVNAEEFFEGNREIFSCWCYDIQKITGFMCGKIFKRDFLAGTQIPNIRNCEDLAWMSMLLDKCSHLVFSPHGQYVYHDADFSITHEKTSLSSVKNRLFADKTTLEIIDKKNSMSREYAAFFNTAWADLVAGVREYGYESLEEYTDFLSTKQPSWNGIVGMHKSLKHKAQLLALKLLGCRLMLSFYSHVLR